MRNPWLDKELTDFLKTLPVRYRIDRYLYRKTATRMFPELMALPVATRNSLENWSEALQKDLALQSFLKKHLIENRNSFHELLNPEAVRNLYQQAIQPGGARSSLKQRAMKTTKDYLRKQTPQLYRLLKPSLMGKIKTKELPAQELLFRLLILKIWFDEFVDGQAQPQDWHR